MAGSASLGSAPPAGPTRDLSTFGWFTDSEDGREVSWHNGGTGGFSAFAGFDAEAGLGVVVLGNTDRWVDPIGRQLLGLDPRERGGTSLPMLAVTLLGTVLAGGVVFANRRPDRLGLVRDASTGVFLLLVVRNIGTWETVPAVVWLAGVALLAVATERTARRWPELPVRAYGRRWVRAAGAALPVALCVGVLVTMALA